MKPVVEIRKCLIFLSFKIYFHLILIASVPIKIVFLQALSKNGGQQPVRRILSSKKELSVFNMDSIPSVSSVLRGAEGPSQVKKMLGKSVVITRPGGHSGLSMVRNGLFTKNSPVS
jgi:hypothetical protein